MTNYNKTPPYIKLGKRNHIEKPLLTGKKLVTVLLHDTGVVHG